MAFSTPLAFTACWALSASARETASGFFYFRTPFREGSTLYLTGLREAQTGKELFYFEILLEK